MNILRVAPCSEFRVRDELHQMGRVAFVPVEFEVSKFGKGRESIRRSPVVRGYVFADVPAIAWDGTRRLIPAIKGKLFIDGHPYTLTAAGMAAIELLSRPIERANASGWSPGDRVRVRRGAFAELNAVVAAIERGHVMVNVEMFGKVHQAKVPSDALEAASHAPPSRPAK